MDSSDILMLVVGIALGTYFHEPVSSVIPILERKPDAVQQTEAVQ